MIPNGGTFGGLHTRDYFGMYPKSKIIFAPPEPKYNFVDIPGADGSLDYTEIVAGMIPRNNRKGSIEFLVLTGVDYPVSYSKCLNHFDGKIMNVILDDDPSYYYHGRLKVNEWKSWEGHSNIVIDYDLDPYKYPVDSTGDHDWLWNELFNNVIYYGTFDVSGTKARNLINPSSSVLTPIFICSAPMTITFGGSVYQLSEGTTDMPGFQLSPGNNQMTFAGTGRVLVDYSIGKEL